MEVLCLRCNPQNGMGRWHEETYLLAMCMLPPMHCLLNFPQALAGGSLLTNLNLSGNNIGDAGAKALAEMLKVGLGTFLLFSLSKTDFTR